MVWWFVVGCSFVVNVYLPVLGIYRNRMGQSPLPTDRQAGYLQLEPELSLEPACGSQTRPRNRTGGIVLACVG